MWIWLGDPARIDSVAPPHQPNWIGEPGFAERHGRFSKIKALLKQMNPLSIHAICDALKTILEKFKPREHANFIRHSGYVQA